MRDYFIRRFLLLPPTLIGVTMIVFIITRFVPGGPVERAIMEMRMASFQTPSAGGAASEQAISEEQIQQLKQYFGFDKPVLVAYGVWLGKVARGDLGTSYRYHESVVSMVRERLPISLFYGIATLILTYAICLPLGIAKAIRHRTVMDNVTSVVIFAGYAVPGYALGAIVLLLFAVNLNWFPMGGFTSLGFAELAWWEKVLDILHHGTLPLICYLVGSFALTTMLMKNNLMDNLAADYVRTAVAKGAGFKKAVFGHALRNSMIPVATTFGQNITLLVGGSFLIEYIFDIDGFGLLGLTSILDRDYMVVMGITLISSFLLLLGNILSDMLVAAIDPRIRFK